MYKYLFLIQNILKNIVTNVINVINVTNVIKLNYKIHYKTNYINIS